MDKIDDLPPGWTTCTISDVIASDGVFVDGDWVESKDQDPDGDIRLIQLADIGDSHFQDKSARFLTKSKAIDLNCTFLQKEDLLVARMPDPLGRCCIFPLESDSGYVTVVDVCVIRAGKSSADHKFLMYLINSPEVRTQISSLQSGSTRKRISRKNLNTVALPIAPLNEQRQIVAKIEELFSELDKGIESLKTARSQLKIYRQAMLKHAFEGKLTAQWREEHKDKLESPEQLLARIQQEREARYQQQLTDWQAALKTWEQNGKDGKKPGKPSEPNFMALAQIKDLSLPDDWTNFDLGTLAAESVLGKMLDKEKNVGHMRPYLGNINVRWGIFDLANLKLMKIEDSEIERYRLNEGDLVVCEGGEPGRCAIWKDSSESMFIQKALHRVRFTESFDPYFACYYIFYASTTQRIAKYFTGTTIKHLTRGGLQKIQFPLCSVTEQREIVKILDKQLSGVEAVDCEISKELAKAETLRQSILKKAFSGQLVPQDPNDEPAAVLCDRIRAAKAAQPKTAKKPRRDKTASSPLSSGETRT
jgi:type I restriction enzyme S subunit